MKFESISGKHRSRRSNSSLQAPAIVESLEARSLLTVLSPTVLSPTGTVDDATPTITWEAVDKATSYDLWVSDAEQRTVEFIKDDITATSFTPTTELNLCRTRVLVRANFADGPSSAWSVPTEFVVKVKPVVTGPVIPFLSAPQKLDETKPTITWTSPPGAFRFEISISDRTTLTSRTILVPNLTPLLDADGNTQPDGQGDVLRQEVRSFELEDDLPMASYRVFVRSLDDGGRTSDWSDAYDFDVAPPVKLLRPAGTTLMDSLPTFQSSQVVKLSISGTPTAGSYSIALTTAGASAQTFKTVMLPYNASTGQVQAAVRGLKGFETTDVITTGFSPNLTHQLRLPTSVGKVAASVTETVNPGIVTVSTTAAPGILLEWAPVDGATHYEVQVSKVSKVGADEKQTQIYSVPYLTTTSYQIPALLADGDYVFSVRAKRRHQVTEINLTGTPTSGSYRIVLTTFGKDGTTTTQQTTPLSYDSTAAQIKAAVVSLKGFENADVIAGGTTPNLKYLLEIPQTVSQVNVNVVGSISPGTLTHTTIFPAEVVGIWSRLGYFSTIKNPVVTGPAGIVSTNPDKRLVTDARPIVEWTPIDKAGRYDIWVELSNAKTPYLRTTASTNFYQFEQDIKPGKYQVWIRAVSTTGALTGWSAPYAFEATGGAPMITSPAANANVLPIPDITWTPVSDAKSYDIWIAKVGDKYDYIRASGITLTTYTPTDPLPTGTYRVWVRAVKTDGTALAWSTPITFTVTSNDAEQPSAEFPKLLAALLQTTGDAQADAVAEVAKRKSIEPEITNAPTDIDGIPFESTAILPTPAAIPAMTLATEGFIQQLAEQCTAAEWWMPHGTVS